MIGLFVGRVSAWIVCCGVAIVVEVVEVVDLSGHEGVLAVVGTIWFGLFGFGGCFRCVCIYVCFIGAMRGGA